MQRPAVVSEWILTPTVQREVAGSTRRVRGSRAPSLASDLWIAARSRPATSY
ncbi:MAG: hypothetical protein ACJ8ET_00700 [Sphingomicrobium sp.]